MKTKVTNFGEQSAISTTKDG